MLKWRTGANGKTETCGQGNVCSTEPERSSGLVNPQMSADENAYQAIEDQFASDDAREADTDPSNSGTEDAAASEKDTGDEVPTTETEGTEGESESSEESGDSKPAKKKPSGVQARIGELTREKYEARREADQLRAQLQNLQQGTQQKEPEPQSQGTQDSEPTLEQFDYDPEKYMEARIEWKLEQRLKAAEAERYQRESQQSDQQRKEAFNQRANEFAANNDDFYDVVFGNTSLPINEPMSQYIMDSENGPNVAYHLGHHPDEAQTIAAMAPHLAIAALARLEDRLVPPKTPNASANTPQITRAPPVAKRVAASSSSGEAMDDMEDHIAAVRKQQGA